MSSEEEPRKTAEEPTKETSRIGKKKDAPVDQTERPGKRARKSIESFQPDDFSRVEPQVKIIKGRGLPLSDVDAIQEAIDGYTMNSNEIHTAHKFLFSLRGKVANKVKKGHILSFTGYLQSKEKAEDGDKRKAMDEEMEKKWKTKASKSKVSELKSLCDFFDVDRSSTQAKSVGKDELVDRLLTFLSKPDKKLTKSFKKKQAASERKKAQAQKKEEKDGAEKDGADVLEKGKDPNDKQLRNWVRAYVRCFNLDKVTTKHALVTASDKFGVDLASKKSRIKELLTEEM